MPIPLPNLDDRRWADLVEQGRALIPLYAPEWTDHNASDPGITLLELLAWIAEMDVFQLNRIPQRHLRRFLALMGLRADPPRPARSVVEIGASLASVALPAALQFSGSNLAGDTVLFESASAVTAAGLQLRAAGMQNALGFHSLTAAWGRRETFLAFGPNPEPETALYLGFDGPFPAGQAVQLYFQFAGERSGWSERQRILDEKGVDSLPPHHSVRTVWEYQGAGGQWLALQPADDTRSFTLSGGVGLAAEQAMAPQTLGASPESLYYVRCRMVAGAFDAPPLVARVLVNAVEVVQAIPAAQSFPIARDASVSGAFTPGQAARFELRIHEGAIVELRAAPGSAGREIRILEYRAPTPLVAGVLTLEAVFAGFGTGDPNQTVALSQFPVVEAGFELYTLEGTVWREWERRDDLAASSRTDAHFLLNSNTGEITFGDGENGRVVPEEAQLFAIYRATAAQAGLLGALEISRVADNPHNRALPADPAALNLKLKLANPLAAEGGRAGETLEHTLGRAIQLREARLRAVALGDYESLALDAPGTHVARAAARANLCPGMDCFTAPGVVTVIVVPAMPGATPLPSAGLLGEIQARLDARRVIGTRVMVTGPRYLEVAVSARVKAFPKAARARVREQVAAAIDAFFHPLTGGPDGTGWPFGRDVYRSEILQVIDETPGVDHVLSLELIAEGCPPQCGNLCLRPTWLVAAGRHEIEVV